MIIYTFIIIYINIHFLVKKFLKLHQYIFLHIVLTISSICLDRFITKYVYKNYLVFVIHIYKCTIIVVREYSN